MDDKTLERIKARTEEAEEEGLGLEQLDDLNELIERYEWDERRIGALIAEVERLTAENSEMRSLCGNTYDGLRFRLRNAEAENATLKKVLELACDEIARRKVSHITDIKKESAKILHDLLQQTQEQEDNNEQIY